MVIQFVRIYNLLEMEASNNLHIYSYHLETFAIGKQFAWMLNCVENAEQAVMCRVDAAEGTLKSKPCSVENCF